MNETNRVIAHYLDGRVVKGTTEDFHPDRRQFHLHPIDASAPTVVDNRQLKAVFFVKDFAGNPGRKDLHGFGLMSAEQTQGKKIAIEFKDGERIQGYTLAYTPDRQGFFVVPADPGSNNLRIYVLKGATRQILVGAKAEALDPSARSGQPPDQAAA
jgi:hypothetical protein